MIEDVVNEVKFDAYDKDLNIIEGASVEIKHGKEGTGIKTNLPNLPMDIFNVLNELFLPFIKEGVSLEVNVYGIEDFDLIFSAGPMVNAIRKAVKQDMSELMILKMRESRQHKGRMLKESDDNREELKFATISDLSSLPSDIVPKCLRVLKEYDPDIYKKLVDENPELLNPDSLDDNEDGQFVYETMDELFKAMTEIAPEGFYFDAHPDDGGRYGFWPYDDEEWE